MASSLSLLSPSPPKEVDVEGNLKPNHVVLNPVRLFAENHGASQSRPDDPINIFRGTEQLFCSLLLSL
ncbi:hypothetical protein MUK42_35146 [Musa troglodytarum]|uniref:Uncharacterized protein n=1 Tax=Musa troglodytarum TaxID=320322 RepID=A0A9E7ECV2_9LILI|nr:hypothetical protein MUK42_35146 [Musa troglodytarum]